MSLLEEIKKSDKKPKELLVFLVNKVKKDKSLLNSLPELLKVANDVEKATLIEVLEYLTKENPDYGSGLVGTIASYLDNKSPRVKWEASRVIGNVAGKYQNEAGKAIPKLVVNTKDKGTVVRWSTAFALGEIAKYNPKLRNTLIGKINSLVKKEENNGVKNVYLKALKAIESGKV